MVDENSYCWETNEANCACQANPGLVNPDLDLNGFDAFAKVRILSALAFNSKISNKKCLNIIYCWECLHSAITFAESGCAEDACDFFEQIMLKNAK